VTIQVKDANGDTQTVSTIDDQITIIGAKTDAKSTATDTTSTSAMSVWKQISASVQAIVTALSGTLTVGTHAVTGSGNFATTIADGADSTVGTKTDAKNTATDSTSVSAMSIWKQISASVQSIATSVSGSLTVATHAVTQSGSWILSAGSAVIGKVGIDQTTDGTTNLVRLGTETTKAIGVVRNADGAGNLLTSATRGSERALSAQIVDGSGNQITSFGSGTEYTDDAVAATNPVGHALLAVRRDTLSTSEVSADGDNIALMATNKGKLHVAAELRVGDTAVDLGSGTGGAATPRVIIDSSQFQAPGQGLKAASGSVTIASDQGYAGNVGGMTVTQAASSTIARPADTTAYAIGDLVANSTTAGSVNNLQFTSLARISGGSGMIVGAKIQKSTAGVTNAAFRLHLFATAPTYTSAGDNSPISSVVVASGKSYLGYVDITSMVAFSDVAWGTGSVDNSRGGICFVASAQTIYGLLEARGTYTPGSAEVFTITLDALQD
jgi:hypothetical protein